MVKKPTMNLLGDEDADTLPETVKPTETQIQQLNELVRGRIQAMLVSMPVDIQNSPVDLCMGVYFQASFECLTAHFMSSVAEETTVAIHNIIAMQWELLMREYNAEQQSHCSGHGRDGIEKMEP